MFRIVVLFCLFFSSGVFALEKIAIIDLKKIVSNSVAASKLTDNLQKEIKEGQKDINSKVAELEKKYKEILEQKDILTAEAFKEKQQELLAEKQILQQQVANKTKELEKSYALQLTQIEKKIQSIIEYISNKEDYNLILNKNEVVFSVYPEITDDVTIQLNKTLPEVSLKKTKKN
jgi:outer membrane protein